MKDALILDLAYAFILWHLKAQKKIQLRGLCRSVTEDIVLTGFSSYLQHTLFYNS